MIREIEIQGLKIEYELIRKRVKNINLRITSANKITVSANNTIPIAYVEKLLKAKSDFILNALKKIQAKNESPSTKKLTEKELVEFINNFCRKIYPYYRTLTSVDFPVIKFRRMKSRWGSCCPSMGRLTFNTNLIFASYECIEYVVHHEFTHFIHPNHSSLFYAELSKTCPDWKKMKKKLNEINILL